MSDLDRIFYGINIILSGEWMGIKKNINKGLII